MIGKVLKQRKQEIVMMLVISMAVYAFGMFLLVFILKIDKGTTTFEIATLMEAMVSVMFLIVFGAFSFSGQYNTAVGMGATRKAFIPAYYAVNLLFVGIQYGVVVLSHILESAAIRQFYSGYEKEAGIETVLFSKYVIPVLLLFAAVQLVLGGFLLKFGRKAFWVIWALWMALCIFPARLSDLIENDPEGAFAKALYGITGFFTSLGGVCNMLLLLVLAAAGLLLVWCMLKKQQVTDV